MWIQKKSTIAHLCSLTCFCLSAAANLNFRSCQWMRQNCHTSQQSNESKIKNILGMFFFLVWKESIQTGETVMLKMFYLSFLEISNAIDWVRRVCWRDLEPFHLRLVHVLIVYFWPLKGSLCNVIGCVVIFCLRSGGTDSTQSCYWANLGLKQCYGYWEMCIIQSGMNPTGCTEALNLLPGVK